MPMPKNRRYRCRYRYRYLSLEFLHRTLYFSRFQYWKLTMDKFSPRNSILDAFSRIIWPKLWFMGSLEKLPKYLGSKNVAMANSSLWLCFQWFWIHWSWHSLELVWKLKMRENQNKTVAGYRTDSLRVSADTDADTPSISRTLNFGL